MRRLKIISLLLIAALGFISAYLLVGWGAHARAVRLHAKDLPEHRLVIVPPTDPSFEQRVRRIAAGRDARERRLIEGLRPFSVVVENRGRRDVIAYRLRWDILSPNGVVTTHFTTYSEPGALMGRDPRRGSGAGSEAGFSIKAHSGRYVSLASSIGESQDPNASLGIRAAASAGGTSTRCSKPGRQGMRRRWLTLWPRNWRRPNP